MSSSAIRLLLVEDNEIDRLAFERFIRDHGLPYDHRGAGSVSEGKTRLRAEPFDVVLLDYSLRDGTAFDLMEDVPREVPIVIITGSGNEEIAVKAMKIGASDYLIKDPENNWLKTVPITVQNVIKAKGAEKKLEKAYAELERRVEERTRELLLANEKLRREIDQRRQAEEALRQSEERFRALTETTSEWIWEMDTEGVLTYASPRITDLLGYQPAEVVGKRRFDLMPAAEAYRVGAQYESSVRSQKPFKGLESVNKHKDGREIILASSGVPYADSRGTIRGYRGIDLDISDLKKAQELLVQSERLAAIAELATGVAHNFNNLLQIVVSGLQLVSLKVESGDLSAIPSTVENILESSRLASETVKWLQDFAQFQKEPMTEGGAVFSLSDTVARAVEVVKPWWKTGPEWEGVLIDLGTSLHPGCSINGMEGPIFEVVVNLLKNAAEALPRGGRIEVSTAVEQGVAVLRVGDNGVGIPRENLKRIFEPFFSTKGYKGTGMGLASAYGIVKRHGGDITVQSVHGQGTEFTVHLPLATKPPDMVRREAFAFPWQLRILLIDDEALIAKALGLELTARGQTVFKARSGLEGLEIFEREPVDVVITDLGMPVINGWEVARRIAESCERRSVPKPLLLLLTGWGVRAAQDNRVAELGIDAVVPKPVTLQKLLKIIGALMEKKEGTHT